MIGSGDITDKRTRKEDKKGVRAKKGSNAHYKNLTYSTEHSLRN
jgi:hypothetical protein